MIIFPIKPFILVNSEMLVEYILELIALTPNDPRYSTMYVSVAFGLVMSAWFFASLSDRNESTSIEDGAIGIIAISIPVLAYVDIGINGIIVTLIGYVLGLSPVILFTSSVVGLLGIAKCIREFTAHTN